MYCQKLLPGFRIDGLFYTTSVRGFQLILGQGLNEVNSIIQVILMQLTLLIWISKQDKEAQCQILASRAIKVQKPES